MTLTRRAVSAQQRLVVTAAGALLFYGIAAGALWPSMKSVLSGFEDLFPEAFLQFSGGSAIDTPVGWMNAELLSMIAPGALIAVAVGSGVRATAGEERAKTLGVVLSAPISRTTFLVSKLAAMLAHVVLAAVALAVALQLGSLVGDLGLTASGILGACVHTASLALVFGAFATLLATITGSTRISNAVVVTVAAAAFTAATFLPLKASLATGAKASPWYYFISSDPLANGIDAAHVAVLLLAATVLAALSLLTFNRRDLRG